MAWEGPSSDKPVWCGSAGAQAGVPTAQTVSCTTTDPALSGTKMAALSLNLPTVHAQETASDASAVSPTKIAATSISYQKFTSQDALGKYLTQQYRIRTPQELSSCEVCHR
jgi:hypothetical protein